MSQSKISKSSMNEASQTVTRKVRVYLNASLLCSFVLFIAAFIYNHIAPLSDRPIDYQSPASWFLSATWLSHIENNAQYHRFSIDEDISDLVATSDGWWAVGGAGEVLTSRDGQHWQITHKVDDILYNVAAANNTILATGYEFILRSGDGGKSWRKSFLKDKDRGDGIAPIIKLTSNGNTALVATSRTIVRSEDGGKTWSELSIDLLQKLIEQNINIHIMVMSGNGKTIIIGLTNHALLLSTNAGEDWELVDLGFPKLEFSIYDISISENGEKIIIIGRDIDPVLSVDSGENWVTIFPSDNSFDSQQIDEKKLSANFPPVGSASFSAGGQDLIMIDYNGRTFQRTKNGGDDWEAGYIPTDQVIQHLSFAKDGSILAITRNRIFVSKQDNYSWDIFPLNLKNNLYTTAITPDGKTALVAGENSILLSKDNGENWQTVTPSFWWSKASRLKKSFSIRESFILNDGRIITLGIVGDKLTILQSTDSGISWNEISTIDITIFFDDSISADIDSSGKTIVISTGIYLLLSNNGGVDFKEIARFNIDDIDYVNDVYLSEITNSAWLIGSLGTVVNIDMDKPNDQEAFSVIKSDLNSISSSEKDEIMMAVGNAGWLLKRKSHSSKGFDISKISNKSLSSIALSEDGEVVLAVGESGTLLNSRDGGYKWQDISLSTPLNLNNVTMSSDGTTAIVVGDKGTLLRSEDGGQNWQDANEYTKYPPPISLLMALIGLSLAAPWHRKIRHDDENELNKLQDNLLNDNPTHSVKDDRIGRNSVALAISKFIRNRSTTKPFTLAISGEWGEGKSSLMRMVQEDLKQTGFYPVWFNAWHHQQDNFLAGLLTAMSRQGLPKLWQLNGLRFRTILFFIRLKRLAFGLMLMAITLGVLFYFRQPIVDDFKRYIKSFNQAYELQSPFYFSKEKITNLKDKVNDDDCKWEDLRGRYYQSHSEMFSALSRTSLADRISTNLQQASTNNNLPSDPEIPPKCLRALAHVLDLEFLDQPDQYDFHLMEMLQDLILPLLIAFAGVLTALPSVLSLFSFFGIDQRYRSNLSQLEENNPEAIQSVRVSLEEIGKALGAGNSGRSLVFFVDDLDRMRGPQLYQFLELLNLLSTDNRSAFFVLGMAYHRVLKNLEDELKNALKTDDGEAEQYLKKMINVVLELKPPGSMSNLLEDTGKVYNRDVENDQHRQIEIRNHTRRILQVGFRWLDHWLIPLAIVVFMVWGGYQILKMEQIIHEKNRVITSTQPEQNFGGNIQTEPVNLGEGPTPEMTTVGSETTDFVPKVSTLNILDIKPNLNILLSSALLAFLLYGYQVYLRWLHVDDTAEFKSAVKIWLDVLSGSDYTPRQAKRTVNQLRMIAMYKRAIEGVEVFDDEERFGQMLVIYKALHGMGLDMSKLNEIRECLEATTELNEHEVNKQLQLLKNLPIQEGLSEPSEAGLIRLLAAYKRWRPTNFWPEQKYIDSQKFAELFTLFP